MLKDLGFGTRVRRKVMELLRLKARTQSWVSFKRTCSSKTYEKTSSYNSIFNLISSLSNDNNIGMEDEVGKRGFGPRPMKDAINTFHLGLHNVLEELVHEEHQ